VDVVPLISHLETDVQKLIHDSNFEDTEKLKHSLEKQLRMLEQAADLVDS
jgi:hypothetical protein